MDFCLDNMDAAHKHDTRSAHNRLLGGQNAMETRFWTKWADTQPPSDVKAGSKANKVPHVPLQPHDSTKYSEYCWCGTFSARYFLRSPLSFCATSSWLLRASLNKIPCNPFLHKIHSKRANEHRVVRSICTFFCERKQKLAKQTKKRLIRGN